jgi:hypothetical protein
MLLRHGDILFVILCRSVDVVEIDCVTAEGISVLIILTVVVSFISVFDVFTFVGVLDGIIDLSVMAVLALVLAELGVAEIDLFAGVDVLVLLACIVISLLVAVVGVLFVVAEEIFGLLPIDSKFSPLLPEGIEIVSLLAFDAISLLGVVAVIALLVAMVEVIGLVVVVGMLAVVTLIFLPIFVVEIGLLGVVVAAVVRVLPEAAETTVLLAFLEILVLLEVTVGVMALLIVVVKVTAVLVAVVGINDLLESVTEVTVLLDVVNGVIGLFTLDFDSIFAIGVETTVFVAVFVVVKGLIAETVIDLLATVESDDKV